MSGTEMRVTAAWVTTSRKTVRFRSAPSRELVLRL